MQHQQVNKMLFTESDTEYIFSLLLPVTWANNISLYGHSSTTPNMDKIVATSLMDMFTSLRLSDMFLGTMLELCYSLPAHPPLVPTGLSLPLYLLPTPNVEMSQASPQVLLPLVESTASSATRCGTYVDCSVGLINRCHTGCIVGFPSVCVVVFSAV